MTKCSRPPGGVVIDYRVSERGKGAAPWTEVSVALTGSGGYYLEKTSLRSLQQAPPHSFLKTKQNKTNFDFDASVQMSQAELNEALEIVYFKLFFPMLGTSTCPFACEVTHILRAIGPTGPFPLTGRARWLPKQIQVAPQADSCSFCYCQSHLFLESLCLAGMQPEEAP